MKRRTLQAHLQKIQVTTTGRYCHRGFSAFWAACSADGSIEKLCKYGSFESLHGLLGVCFSGEMEANCFPYAIGTEYNGAPIEDGGLDVVDIPAFTYAVFTCKGPMPDAFKDTYRQICTEFFPQSGYEYGNGVELEVYPSADVNDPNYYCEIWIAVKEGNNLPPPRPHYIMYLRSLKSDGFQGACFFRQEFVQLVNNPAKALTFGQIRT